MATSKHHLTRVEGGWVKFINGKTRWVASSREAPTPADADRLYEERFKALWQAPTPAHEQVVLTVRVLGDLFLDTKLAALTLHELGRESYDEYVRALKDFCAAVGEATAVSALSAADFAKFRAYRPKWGPARRKKWIILIRSMFKWASGAPLRLPVPDYGAAMRLPRQAEFRRVRAERGRQSFSAEELHLLLALAPPRLKLGIYLGLNCGFGPTDMVRVTKRHLHGGFLIYGRSKTFIPRRCPLWPETLAAIDAVGGRGERLIGGSVRGIQSMWERLIPRVNALLDASEQHLKVPALGIYALRRTLRTLGDEKGDPRAIALIMGHLVPDISSLYVDHISDQRLVAVSQYVRSRALLSARDASALPDLRARSQAALDARMAKARRARSAPRRPR